MTNFEMLKSLSEEDFVRYLFGDANNLGCYACLQSQRGMNKNQVWQKHCLGKMGRDANSCFRCRVEWLKTEVGEWEQYYKGGAID